ncbi:MAG: SEL1-like repeat protein [Thiomicrorhabdus sp.]|nr:SEL1-like repeat protein [Thiomicrorhabdus sp.]
MLTLLIDIAEQEFEPAQIDLGQMYSEGLGVEKSDKMALMWFEKSAKKNDAIAQFN